MNPLDAPQRSSIRVALKLQFPTVEVAEYLFRSDVLPYWLSRDSLLQPKMGSLARLPRAVVREAECQSSLTGTVTSLVWPSASAVANASVGPAPDGEFFELVVTLDTEPAPSRVTFRLAPVPVEAGKACRVRIEYGGFTDKDEERIAVKYWQSALNRASRLMIRADKIRRCERQAVIVVHGVGEQRPGQLLRQFVTNVFSPEAGEVSFLKPDYVDSLFGTSMATVCRSKDGTRPKTDVYEFYWAHLIRDTTVTQVYGWMFRLMTSRRKNIPENLIKLVWGLRVAVIAAFLVLAWLTTKDVSGWLTGVGLGSLAALPALAAAGLKVFRDQFIVGYAGDAARYLEPRPENIPRRQEIRETGAQLLNTLHDSGRYSRIIVYGHSLGSVIAYDILSHTWIKRSRRCKPRSKTSSRDLRALEDLLNPRAANTVAVSAEDAQSKQHAAWLEYRRNGFDWLVSDFVTAGSPLTHARWLLNLDAKTDFEELVRDRTFPSCPPQTEIIKSPVPNIHRRVFTFTHAYADERNPRAKRSVLMPHHAGLFALTRWTNLYYPYSGWLNGDPIGGPLAEQFGAWVRDIPINGAKGFAHSRYTDRKLDPKAVLQVRAALSLPFRRPLADPASVSGGSMSMLDYVPPVRPESCP